MLWLLQIFNQVKRYLHDFIDLCILMIPFLSYGFLFFVFCKESGSKTVREKIELGIAMDFE